MPSYSQTPVQPSDYADKVNSLFFLALLLFFLTMFLIFKARFNFTTLRLVYAEVTSFLPPFLAAFHHVSVYPKKELPFFIHFTAGLCSSTAMLAFLTHQFPEVMGVFAKAVSMISRTCVEYL
jgi:hypothetical protein